MVHQISEEAIEPCLATKRGTTVLHGDFLPLREKVAEQPFKRKFFLIKCCHRALSGIFFVIITSESVLLGVYQEFLARHRPDAWSIALSSVGV
jgi:hypothetical protein